MTLGGSAIAVSGGAESGLGMAGGVGFSSGGGSTAVGAWGDVILTVFFAGCLVGVSCGAASFSLGVTTGGSPWGGGFWALSPLVLGERLPDPLLPLPLEPWEFNVVWVLSEASCLLDLVDLVCFTMTVAVDILPIVARFMY